MESIQRKCDFGVLSRPDGSVLFCEDESVVIAGIYGPIEAKAHKIQIDKANVEAHFRPKSGLPGIKDRFQESLIRNICETVIAASLYPRTSIEIMIQEMHNNGQLLSCAVNAACLAALDSGIDLKYLFASVTCFLNKKEELLLKKPLNEKDFKASFTFVFENIEERILASHTEGSFNSELYEKALYLCRDQSRLVFNFFKECLSIK